MGEPATRVSRRAALDAFFASYYRLRPVTATFTGVHEHDAALPDWSVNGLAAAEAEMFALRRTLLDAGRPDHDAVRAFPDDVDLALADAFLEIQIAEQRSGQFSRGNAALWTGEAIFGVLSLVTRDFAPIAERLAHATARLAATPGFLHTARETLALGHPDWDARARRECAAAATLFAEALPAWAATLDVPAATRDAFARASIQAAVAYREFYTFLGTASSAISTGTKGRLPRTEGRAFRPGLAEAKASALRTKEASALRTKEASALRTKGASALRTGQSALRTTDDDALLALLLKRGHWIDESAETLLLEAREALDEAAADLETRARPHGGWAAVQDRLAREHPAVDGYLARFHEIWDACRQASDDHDLVTWPDAPIRYVPIPAHTRVAAPHLYYLFYRSPAAFDRVAVYDYVVPPIEAGMPATVQEERLRATNDSVIKLNHVVHHGGLGHHVQNHHAYNGRSRIGQVAATDAASRIGMFSAGSLAEGWACYACDVMEEIGFLTPLESIAQQHTRVRLTARAVVDLAMHTGRMTLDEAVALYADRAGMPAAAARAEAVKNSMFPGAAVMYWLGTRGLHALRAAVSKRAGAAFSLRRFHDEVLSYGSIPVALIARLMTAAADGADKASRR